MTQAWLFAAAYGAGPYGEGTYNNGAVAGPSAGGGELVKTGVMIVGVVTAVCLTAFIALVVRFWKRKKHINYNRPR